MTLTGDGDLNYELPSGYTVGQDICIAMSNHHGVHNVRNEPVSVKKLHFDNIKNIMNYMCLYYQICKKESLIHMLSSNNISR